MTRIYVAYTLCLLPFFWPILYKSLLEGQLRQKVKAGRQMLSTEFDATSRPDHGPAKAGAGTSAGRPAAGAAARRRARRRGLARTGGALGLLALLLLLVVAVVLAEDRSDDAVQDALEAQAALGRLAAAVTAADAGQWAYLLTRDPSHLAAYRGGSGEARAALDEVERLADGDPCQAERLAGLRPLVEDRLGELADGLGSADRRLLGISLAAVRTERDSGVVAAVRDRLAAAGREEGELLAERRRTTRLLTAALALSLGSFAGFALWVPAGGLRRLERDYAEERAAELARLEAERARDEAAAADRVKAEFLAVMSHEIRTPLIPYPGDQADVVGFGHQWKSTLPL